MAISEDIIVGIDLGTTNSLIAYADEAGPHLIPNPGDATDFLLPSVLSFERTGRLLSIGRQARLHAVERPQTTVHSVKRLMGKGASEIEAEAARLPYQIERRHADAARDIAAIRVGEQTYTPPEI